MQAADIAVKTYVRRLRASGTYRITTSVIGSLASVAKHQRPTVWERPLSASRSFSGSAMVNSGANLVAGPSWEERGSFERASANRRAVKSG